MSQRVSQEVVVEIAMNERGVLLKRSLLAITALVLCATSVSAAPYLKTPQPGEVYKEFTRMNNGQFWRVTDPDATNAGEPGNTPCDFMDCDPVCSGAPAGTSSEISST